MAKKTSSKKADTKLEGLGAALKEEKALLEECEQHELDSSSNMGTVSGDWDDKEAMLICRLTDAISGETASGVFDPVLSTQLIERAARVMAQPASGKAWAVSKNDVAKNMVMNLLLKWYQGNANEGRSHLIKLRQMDVYSGVYGTMFGLVPWRVNSRSGFIGPELLPIEIRNCRPQPHKNSVDESDWFGVKGRESVANLLRLQKAAPDMWKNADKLALELKQKKSGGDSHNEDQSYTESTLFPSVFGDAVFPQVDVYTEYRRDMWITWTPRQIDNKSSHPWILRIVKNPYPEGMLPIVAKDAFPLLGSIIGLGDFERGKTLQFAINSLWNLYLDGVKYSIFPPLHINPDNVVPSSIQWEDAAMWFMNNPNSDVQAMRMAPAGLETFRSTYGFMMSAIQNLAGSTQVTQIQGNEPSFGKTPEGLKQSAFAQSARDEWDRFMMEQCVDDIYTRWIALTTNKLETEQVVRLYEQEIADIKKAYPEDAKSLEIFQSKKRGEMRVDKTIFFDKGKKEPVKFDFELEPGSTMRKDPQEDRLVLTGIINSLGVKIGQQTMLEELRAKGYDINVGELYKRWLMLSGDKKWDKVLVEPEDAGKALGKGGAAGLVVPAGQPVPAAGGPVPALPPSQPAPEAAPAAPGGASPQFRDQQIAAAAKEIFGGIGGIPPTAA